MCACEQSTTWIIFRNLFKALLELPSEIYLIFLVVITTDVCKQNTEENNQKWEKNYKKHGENYVTSWSLVHQCSVYHQRMHRTEKTLKHAISQSCVVCVSIILSQWEGENSSSDACTSESVLNIDPWAVSCSPNSALQSHPYHLALQRNKINCTACPTILN